MLDVVSSNDVFEIAVRTEYWEGWRAIGWKRRIVQKPDRPQAEVGLVEQALRGQPADVSGSNNQRRSCGAPSAAGRKLQLRRGDASEHEKDQGRSPHTYSLGSCGCIVGDEDANGKDSHGCDRRAQDEIPNLVQRVEPEVAMRKGWEEFEGEHEACKEQEPHEFGA
jgi:hypothetical protein